MERKVFITSDGVHATKEIAYSFADFIDQDPVDLEAALLYAGPGKATRDGRSDYEQLLEFGFNRVHQVDMSATTYHPLKDLLQRVDVICLGGGHIYPMMRAARNCGVNKDLLNDELDRGKIIAGRSAGGVMLGPSITVAQWHHRKSKNEVGLKNFNGFNVVNFSVYPHFSENHREEIDRHSKGLPYRVIPITDNQAIKVTGRRIEVIGVTERRSSKDMINAEKYEVKIVLTDDSYPLAIRVRTALSILQSLPAGNNHDFADIRHRLNWAAQVLKKPHKYPYIDLKQLDSYAKESLVSLQRQLSPNQAITV